MPSDTLLTQLNSPHEHALLSHLSESTTLAKAAQQHALI